MTIWLGIVFSIIYFSKKQAQKVKVGSTTYRSQDEFAAEFGRAIGLWGTTMPQAGFFPLQSGPQPVHFSGTLEDGRAAQLNFSARQEKGPSYNAHLAVACDEAPSLVVTREDFGTIVKKWLSLVREVEVGDKAFDDKFLLETKDARAIKALGRSELRHEIEAIFAFAGLSRLEIGKGNLTATVGLETLSPEAFRGLFRTLSRAARTLERVPITVRILGGQRQALRGAQGSAAHARCAYCHDDLTGEEPDLVACNRCATVVHEECWAELGHCPIMGCDGREPERGPAERPERGSERAQEGPSR